MERSRFERGGNLRFVPRAIGALILASIASVGVRLVAKDNRTKQHHGGWTYIDLSESPDISNIKNHNSDSDSTKIVVKV